LVNKATKRPAYTHFRRKSHCHQTIAKEQREDESTQVSPFYPNQNQECFGCCRALAAVMTLFAIVGTAAFYAGVMEKASTHRSNQLKCRAPRTEASDALREWVILTV